MGTFSAQPSVCATNGVIVRLFHLGFLVSSATLVLVSLFLVVHISLLSHLPHSCYLGPGPLPSLLFTANLSPTSTPARSNGRLSYVSFAMISRPSRHFRSLEFYGCLWFLPSFANMGWNFASVRHPSSNVRVSYLTVRGLYEGAAGLSSGVGS